MPRNEVVVLDCVCFSVNAWFRELWRHNDGIYTWIHSVWDITEGLGVKCTARHCLKTLDHHLPWWLLMVRRPGSLHVTLLLWSPTSCCSVPRPCHSAELLRTLVNCGFDTFVSSWCAGPFTCWCRSSAYWLSRVIIKWVNLSFFCFVFFSTLPGPLSTSVVECVKVRTWFQTFNNPYIHSCSKRLVVSSLLDFTCSALLTSAKLGLWKSRTGAVMQPSANYLFFCYWCLEMLLVARICELSAQVSKSVSRRRGHVYVLHARFAAQLCLAGREGDYLVSFAARSGRLTFCSSACCFFSSSCWCFSRAADVWSTPKKQPRGLFIQHVFRAKGRRSTVTDIRVELVRFDCFQSGCRLKCVRPLCSRQLRG